MSISRFYKQLGGLFLVTAGLVFGVHQIPTMQPHLIFSWVSLLFFVLFCYYLFSIGSKSAKSENRNLFGQLFLVSTFFKMLISILIIVGYAAVVKPNNLFFVFPFFAIYAIFTVYEVYFMTKLAKSNKKD